jgi:hypothetical protein
MLNNRNKSLNYVSQLTGVHLSTVKSISRGTGHVWLSVKYPQEYKQLMSMKGNREINSLYTTGKECRYAIDPEGIVHTVTNITRFAKNNGLNPGAFGQVLRGKAKHHKGWKLAV